MISLFFFFFKQKTAYEMRISDWSSDVCSSDLSCHTALEEIRKTWTGVKWLIEVDVRGFFDNIDHDILPGLLARRIDDPVFIGLIGTMLKAGCMDDWKFERTYSGTPQGGVISPLLANIYLHELDQFMEEMRTGFDKGAERKANPAYTA